MNCVLNGQRPLFVTCEFDYCLSTRFFFHINFSYNHLVLQELLMHFLESVYAIFLCMTDCSLRACLLMKYFALHQFSWKCNLIQSFFIIARIGGTLIRISSIKSASRKSIFFYVIRGHPCKN